uniref:NADH-ubiquinone oxidoreductase chain 3 n=1 Tax=Libiocoris heissi TaxID=1176477 RepID=A0A171LH91_9HEMI|nr:NADH dehydrogenase subunit 3 [Libiocoris heissi]AFI54713.1 NADH dehydrogenase subunit 3 [Libiocoris heissi]
MMYSIYALMAATTLILMLMTMYSVLPNKKMVTREKTSPFECGFDPMSHPRTPFSIQFFIIALLFLIFDIEIAIMLPMIITMKTSSMWWTMTMSTFMIILIIGLVYEWKMGALQWAI